MCHESDRLLQRAEELPQRVRHVLIPPSGWMVEEPWWKNALRCQALVEGLSQGICVHQDRIVQFANRAMAEIFGYTSPQEIIGLECLASVVPWDGEAAMLATFLDITARKREEAERPDGRPLQLLFRRQIEAHEAERRRVAATLQEEVAQVLFGLKLALERALRSSQKSLRTRLGNAQLLVTDLIQQVRNLSRDLRPPLLDELGLLPAIEALCERQVAPIHLDIASAVDEGEPRFAPEVETAVYRIVEEALKNVARHAGAGDVAVRLWAEPPTVIVEIEDRGDGFDVDAVLATGATYGLASMRARALSLGGQLSVQSKAGSGTRVIVSLPLPSPIDALPPARLGGHVVR